MNVDMRCEQIEIQQSEHFSGGFAAPEQGLVVLSFFQVRGSGRGWGRTHLSASGLVWNIPLGLSNDLLMALMSLHRGACLHMGLQEKRKCVCVGVCVCLCVWRGGVGVNKEIGRQRELDLLDLEKISGKMEGNWREGIIIHVRFQFLTNHFPYASIFNTKIEGMKMLCFI